MNTQSFSQQISSPDNSSPINWGHFGIILATMILLLGATFMKRPQLFAFGKSQSDVDLSNVPKYYAYVQPAQDAVPLVAGATTNPGPSVINEDGTVSPLDMGDVLGASTQDVVLSLDDIQVNTTSDSEASMQKYIADAQNLEINPVDDLEFQAALSSGNQGILNTQAEKLSATRDALQKLTVPMGLVKLQKLKIIQYNAAISLLQNFTQADNNPELITNSLGEFLKSQEDLDNENNLVSQKYNLNPLLLGGVNTAGIASQTSQ